MKPKSKQLTVKLDDLILDVNNPRFAELYDGSEDEADLIEYLISNEAGEDIAKAIVKAGEFYPDKPLWVIKEGKKFLVKDGNRRCSAVKALRLPGKYKLNLPKTDIEELPVLLYSKIEDINDRIVEEHAGSLFRRWERIAKALEVFKLSELGKTDELLELDSKPGDLIKLASFYMEAVAVGGNDLRQLLRRGRGKSGGKTIIFERLFRDSKACGYTFKNSPSFKIDIKDKDKFQAYVIAIIKYLKTHSATTTDIIDRDKDFIKKLKPYGFDAYPPEAETVDANSSNTTNQGPQEDVESAPSQGTGSTTGSHSGNDNNSTPSSISNEPNTDSSPSQPSANNQEPNNGSGGNNQSTPTPRKSIKKTPTIKRKQLPAGLNQRIKEFFLLDPIMFPNAKTAMARVTFECVLKYVVEKTKFNGRTTMDRTSNFQGVYTSKFSDFTLMKTKFTDLIKNSGIRGAFRAFDLDNMHTIVHNYNVIAIAANAEALSNNLVILIDFMLQDETDLLNSLDLTKIA
ncbi:MAG: hypothetical protein WC756_17705 [Taibaiella sp.]|jgi:hypothetical protein